MKKWVKVIVAFLKQLHAALDAFYIVLTSTLNSSQKMLTFKSLYTVRISVHQLGIHSGLSLETLEDLDQPK